MENRIKEQPRYLFADRTRCATMRANQTRLWFSSVAYTLLEALRRIGLKGTALAQATCQTIRLKLLKIGAQIQVTVRKVWVRLSQSYPYQALFRQIDENLTSPRRGHPLRCGKAGRVRWVSVDRETRKCPGRSEVCAEGPPRQAAPGCRADQAAVRRDLPCPPAAWTDPQPLRSRLHSDPGTHEQPNVRGCEKCGLKGS